MAPICVFEWDGKGVIAAPQKCFSRQARVRKLYLIVDFVNKIVLQDEANTLTEQGNAKTCCILQAHTRNRIVQRWVRAYIRFFYTLLYEGNLASQVVIHQNTKMVFNFVLVSLYRVFCITLAVDFPNNYGTHLRGKC